MKPVELLTMWASFSTLLEDAHLTNEAKVAVGRELLTTIPDEMLCHTSKATREAIVAAINGRLLELEKKGGRGIETGTEEARSEEGVKTLKAASKKKG